MLNVKLTKTTQDTEKEISDLETIKASKISDINKDC